METETNVQKQEFHRKASSLYGTLATLVAATVAGIFILTFGEENGGPFFGKGTGILILSISGFGVAGVGVNMIFRSIRKQSIELLGDIITLKINGRLRAQMDIHRIDKADWFLDHEVLDWPKLRFSQGDGKQVVDLSSFEENADIILQYLFKHNSKNVPVGALQGAVRTKPYLFFVDTHYYILSGRRLGSPALWFSTDCDQPKKTVQALLGIESQMCDLQIECLGEMTLKLGEYQFVAPGNKRTLTTYSKERTVASFSLGKNNISYLNYYRASLPDMVSGGHEYSEQSKTKVNKSRNNESGNCFNSSQEIYTNGHCPECGEEIDKNEERCFECGTLLAEYMRL